MNVGEVVGQLTITRQELISEGYYEDKEDFKIPVLLIFVLNSSVKVH